MKLFNLMQTTFDNFDATINSYLSKSLNKMGISYTDNQLFKIIFNALKGIVQNIMIYIEDAFTEQNVETAIRKKSVYSLAKISGYEPFYGSAATGTIIGTLVSNTNMSREIRKIYVDNYSNIVNESTGMNYVIYLNADKFVFDVSKPLFNYDFKVVQGYLFTSNYTAKGTALESIHVLINGMFDKNYIKVYVNGELWTPVLNLYDMTENGKEYIISIGFDNELDITFGNDIYGTVLTKGDSIKLEYIVHSGYAGNVNKIAGNSFKFVAFGTDYNGNSINLNDYIKLSINNYISGGTNSDSIEKVKGMIGYNSRSNVLASIDNYLLFFKKFSFLGYFNIWVENNSNILYVCALSDNAKNNDLMKQTEINYNEFLLTEPQKQNIITVLKESNNSFAGTSIKFVDPIIYKYGIICYIKIDEQYIKETIENDVKLAIIEYFSKLEYNIKFISKSDILKTILNKVDNIKSITLEIISDENEKAYKNKYYYKYVSKYYNGKVLYNKVRYNYETNLNLGLDNMGNILLENNLCIPVLANNILYYPNKTSQIESTNTMTLGAINIIFI